MAKKQDNGSGAAGGGGTQKRRQVDDVLAACPELAKYIARIGAVQRNFRRFVVIEEDENGYEDHVAIIRLKDDEVDCNNIAYAPSDEEREAIEEELEGIQFPQPIKANSIDALKPKLHPDGRLFICRDRDGDDGIIFVHERIEPKTSDGKKRFRPWTFFQRWRMALYGARPLAALAAAERKSAS